MSAPAIVFALVGVLVFVTLLVRRRAYLPFAIGGISSGLIGLFVLYAPFDTAISFLGLSLRLESTWGLLGRPMGLDPTNRAGVGFLFLVGALFFSLGWVVSPGRSFVPAGLIALGLLAGALSIEPFLFAAIFLELAAMACVLILIPPGSRSERSVLSLLVLYTMAMMAILFTGWLLENVGVTSVTPELATRVVLLLGLGFVILLFIPPFHYWLPSVAQRVNPYSLAFVAIILQSSGIFILLRFLDNFAWMRADPRIMAAIQAAGILMIAFGTLVAITQVSFLKTAVYVLLADIGVSLLAVGASMTSGSEIAIGLTSVRVISLGLWGLGAALMSESGYSRAAGQRAPIAAAAALLGLLSLTGLPLTAGFPWRWALFTRLPDLGALLLAVSMLVIVWSVLRWTRTLFDLGPIEIEEPRRRAVLVLLASACLLLGVLPQLAIPWVAQASTTLLP